MLEKQKLKIDFYIVLSLILLGVPFVLITKASFFGSTIVFFAMPACYLFVRKPVRWRRTFLGATFFGTFLGTAFALWAELNKAWVINPSRVFIHQQFLGIVQIDEIMWGFFWIFFLVVFYEHFFENERTDSISPNFKYGLIPAVASFAAEALLVVFKSDWLKFNYAYLILGIIAMVPFLILANLRPKLLVKFIKISLFFTFVFLCFELTAVSLGQWTFPGSYLGRLDIFGLLIPYEELFFWILLSPMVVLTEYEFFVDDMK